MTLVVDASVAAKWFIQEPETPFAMAIQRDGGIVAPDLIVAEVMNALWKHLRAGRITVEQAVAGAIALPRSLTGLIPSADLAPRAIEIAVALDHPVYDAFYLAAAERHETTLITADGRLLQKARRTRFAKLVKPLVR